MSDDAKPGNEAALRARRIQRARRKRARQLPTEELNKLKSETTATVQRATVAMLATMLILLIFNSGGLKSYARDLPESALANQVVWCADWWHGKMEQVGASRPKMMVRQMMDSLRHY